MGYPMSILMDSFLIGLLAFLGSLSPLLTATKLFQLKEWRLDRLREHLRSEGWFGQLFGIARPVIVVLYLAGLSFYPDRNIWFLRDALGLLALLTIVQTLLRRQPRPVWTKKALLVVVTALLLTVLAIVFTEHHHPFALPLVVLFQPLSVFLAWLLWKPVDIFLKNRAQEAARMLRAAKKDIICIGITGSVGKTTTKALLAHVLAPRGAVATPAYVNSEMGVASWLASVLKTDTGHRTQDTKENVPLESHVLSLILIVEMGAYRKGEIKKLCDIAQPTIGIITAVGSQHLGLFGSEQAIRDAKAELLEALPSSGHAFVNSDDEGARSIAQRAICPVTTVGIQDAANLRATNVKDAEAGLTFTIGNTSFLTPLRGLHNITNILLTIAVAKHIGMRDEEIREQLKTFQPLGHTFSVKEEHGVTILDDTHNASPLSFRAGLAWAAAQQNRPRVLIASGLLEQGSDEDRVMQELGALARTCVERVIFTSKRGKKAFDAGYQQKSELLARHTPPLPAGALLICIGRMPLASLQRLLPAQTQDAGLKT